MEIVVFYGFIAHSFTVFYSEKAQLTTQGHLFLTDLIILDVLTCIWSFMLYDINALTLLRMHKLVCHSFFLSHVSLLLYYKVGEMYI